MYLLCVCNFVFTMQNRRVVLITNVKPGKLRDVMSEGLVCVSCQFITLCSLLRWLYALIFILLLFLHCLTGNRDDVCTLCSKS